MRRSTKQSSPAPPPQKPSSTAVEADAAPFGVVSLSGLVLDLLPFQIPLLLIHLAPIGWAPQGQLFGQLLSVFTTIVYLAAKLSVSRRTALPPNSDPTLTFREEGSTMLVPVRYPSRAEKAGTPTKKVTMAELRKHNTPTDLWLGIDGHAYDLTSYAKNHPGGALIICHLGGKDATDVFANYHPASVYRTMLPQFHVGEIVDHKVSDFVKEHRSIRQELLRRGMFETDYAFYVMQFTRCLAMFGTAMWLTIGGTSTEQRLCGAAVLAIYWQQLAFIGHDIGHNATSQTKASDFNWGTVFATATGGISVAWWKHNHNVHHVVCNSVEHDPDVQHQPLFATSTKAFEPYTSSFYNVDFSIAADPIAQALVGVQHLLFFPVMMLARFFLYVRSWMHLVGHSGSIGRRSQQIVHMAAFTIGLTALINTLPNWSEALMYLFTSHAIAGVLHLQIVLSHFPMDMYKGLPYNDDTDEWLIMQCRTTQNISCPQWLDWFHGGLQFQIEHHIWPRLPRHNLREAKQLVKPYCKRNDINYVDLPWFEAIAGMITSMRAVAKEARTCPSKSVSFYDTNVWAVLNARG